MSATRDHEKIVLGRAWLIQRMPYLSRILFALRPVESKACPAMAVDMWGRLYYNPDFVERVPTPHVAFVLAHEALHLLGLDFERYQSHPETRRLGASEATQKAWNVAADVVINETLRQDLRIRPEYLLYIDSIYNNPEPFRHLTKEGHYENILRNMAGGGTGQAGAGHPQGGQASPSGSLPQGGRSHGAKGQPQGSIGENAAHGSGSCADGIRRPWETSDVPGWTPLEREAIVEETIREAARHVGSVPDMLRRLIEEQKSRVDWRSKLRHVLLNILGRQRMFPSYDRPNRRRGAMPAADGSIVWPRWVGQTARIAIAIDTSGSMSDADIGQAVAEAVRIIRDVCPDGAQILVVDAEVHEVFRAREERDIVRRLIGGGGTDMGKAIRAAKKLRPAPQALIILTDGYTPWPDDRPPFPVVVGVIGADPSAMENVPRWAKGIPIPKEK